LLPPLRQEVARAHHALSVVLGQAPAVVLPADVDLAQITLPREIPVRLPSELAHRRPDILAAEHTLKSANADIGAARAAFFPTITLTGGGGTASTALEGLFAPGSQVWNFSPSISWPIFSAGTAKAELDVTKAGKQIEIANYEKAIQTAFREVSDALVAKKFLDEQLADSQSLADALQKRYELADARYQNGVDNYLTVLTAQQDHYSAQQNLIETQFSRLSNLISLYQSLGGGWRESAAQTDSAKK